MNSELKKIFILEAIFASINVYVGIFVNFYFWEKDETLRSLFLYNGLLFIFAFFGYLAGTYVLIKSKPKLAYYGSAFSSVMLFVILLNANLLDYLFLLVMVALFSGVMLGLFYAPANHFVSLLATNEEIKIYKSKASYIVNLLSVGLPILSGVLIYYFGFNSSFVLMLVISLFYLYRANKVPAVQVSYSDLNWKKVKETKYDIKLLIYMVISIVILEFASMAKSILLFQLSTNELYLSYMNVANVVAVTICYWIIVKIIHVPLEKQQRWYSLALLLSFLVFAFSSNSIMYFISMVLIVAAVFFYRYTTVSIPFQYINQFTGEEKLILLAKREFYLTIGRIIIFFMMFLYVEDLASVELRYGIYLSMILVAASFLLFKNLLLSDKEKETREKKKIASLSASVNSGLAGKR